MEIGFIGYGEASFELSIGFKNKGISEIFAYDNCNKESPRYYLLKENAKKANVKLLDRPQDVLTFAKVIFVAVPSRYSIEACQSVLSNINNETLYIDVSAATPNVKHKISQIVIRKGGKFVDASMMGPLTIYKNKVPIFASGNGTKKFINIMKHYGMNIKYISEHAGDASAIKLLRSIYMKGIAAVLVEVLEAAVSMNMDEFVLESLEETMDDSTFRDLVNQLITGTSIHSKRRADELKGSLEILENLNLNSILTSATKEKLEYISSLSLHDKFGSRRPAHWKEAINKILDLNKVRA